MIYLGKPHLLSSKDNAFPIDNLMIQNVLSDYLDIKALVSENDFRQIGGNAEFIILRQPVLSYCHTKRYSSRSLSSLSLAKQSFHLLDTAF